MAGPATDLGPVQLLVIAFEDAGFDGAILAELRSLRDQSAVRLLDLLFVAKDEGGGLAAVEQSDLSAEETAELGALAGALIGLGAEGDGALTGSVGGAAAFAGNGSFLGSKDVWFLADAIPNGTSAAVVLLEHRWAIPLRDAVVAAAGHDLIDRWIHPEDLAAVGEIGG